MIQTVKSLKSYANKFDESSYFLSHVLFFVCVNKIKEKYSFMEENVETDFKYALKVKYVTIIYIICIKQTSIYIPYNILYIPYILYI